MKKIIIIILLLIPVIVFGKEIYTASWINTEFAPPAQGHGRIRRVYDGQFNIVCYQITYGISCIKTK